MRSAVAARRVCLCQRHRTPLPCPLSGSCRRSFGSTPESGSAPAPPSCRQMPSAREAAIDEGWARKIGGPKAFGRPPSGRGGSAGPGKASVSCGCPSALTTGTLSATPFSTAAPLASPPIPRPALGRYGGSARSHGSSARISASVTRKSWSGAATKRWPTVNIILSGRRAGPAPGPFESVCHRNYALVQRLEPGALDG